MSFLDSIRMNSLFRSPKIDERTGQMTSEGSSLTPRPVIDPMDDMTRRFTEFDNMRFEQSRDRNRILNQDRENQMIRPPINPMISQGMQEKTPRMNTVMGGMMTPFQEASIALRKEEMQRRDDNQDQTRDISQQRVSIQDSLARNPNMRIVETPEGVFGVNPKTGEKTYIGSSGELSDENKIIINARNKRMDAETSAETAKDLEGVKQANRVTSAATKTQADIDAAALKGKELGTPITMMKDGVPTIFQVDKTGKKVDLKGAEGGSTLRPNAPLSPSGQATNLINRARQYAIENPWARQFMNTDDPDNLIIPPGGRGGPDEPTHKQIREAIYGPTMSRSTKTPITNTATKAPEAPKGWKYVPKPDGGWTAVKSDG